MPIRSINIFAKRISYQSTCVKIRTTFSAVVPVPEETTSDYYSEEFSIRRTSGKSILSGIENKTSIISEVSGLKYSLDSRNHPHRMPIVAAVVAHRRFYPAATSLASSSAGLQRSSCAVRLNNLHILAQQPKGPSVHSGGVDRKSSKIISASGGTFPTGHSVKGSSRPLLELKQLGGLLNKENGKSAVLAESRRYYAKGRDKPKSNKTQVLVNENEMAEVINVDKLKSQLGAVIEEMKEDFTKQLNIRGAAGKNKHAYYADSNRF